jgi:hypothetical protein
LPSHQIASCNNYPPSDGYENVQQLNVVTRAILISILICSELRMKENGYHEIVGDVNDLVVQGDALIFISDDWV